MKVEKGDLDFEYFGSRFTEHELIAKGYKAITAAVLLSKIQNKTVYGEYPNGYKFVANIQSNGTTEGVNNVGSIDVGKWLIDSEENTLKLEWKNTWIDTITRAYAVDENIEFYDIDTGRWRTTFRKLKEWSSH